MPTKSCLNCAFRTLNPQQCPIIGHRYTEDHNQVCPYWVNELPKCEVCGKIVPDSMFTQKSDGSWIRICKNCKSIQELARCVQKALPAILKQIRHLFQKLWKNAFSKVVKLW